MPLALVALVNLGFYALAVYPLSLKVSASEHRAAAARTQLAVAEREDKDVRSTLRLTEQASKDLGRFYKDILPADLTVARRQTYEHLAALAREHNLAIPRRSYRVDEGYKGRSSGLNIAHGADRRLRGHARFHLRSGNLAGVRDHRGHRAGRRRRSKKTC